MSQTADSALPIIERRTGRSKDEFTPENLSFEETLDRFLSVQNHINTMEKLHKTPGQVPEGVGSWQDVGKTAQILHDSAAHYAARLRGPELDKAIQKGELSPDVLEAIQKQNTGKMRDTHEKEPKERD